MGKKYCVDNVRAKLKEKFGDVVSYEPMAGDNAATKIRLIDVDFGIFYATLANVRQKQCHGHPLRSLSARTKKNTYTSTEINDMAKCATGGKVSLSGEYHGMLIKSEWKDEDHGQFLAFPCNIIHKGTRHPAAAPDRRRDTFIKKHGVDHYLKDASEYRRVQQSLRKGKTGTHWSTGEELHCDSAWELAVVNYLNSRKEEYEIHPRSFAMPNGRTYWPDFYLKERDTWVEVKGRWLGRSREKWNWFHEQFPNSELWDRKKLSAMGLINCRGYSVS